MNGYYSIFHVNECDRIVGVCFNVNYRKKMLFAHPCEEAPGGSKYGYSLELFENNKDFRFSDSVENQEGGAMYISCGDDAVAVEAEMGYVPNNPLFGLPLDSPQVNYTLFAPNSIQIRHSEIEHS